MSEKSDLTVGSMGSAPPPSESDSKAVPKKIPSPPRIKLTDTPRPDVEGYKALTRKDENLWNIVRAFNWVKNLFSAGSEMTTFVKKFNIREKGMDKLVQYQSAGPRKLIEESWQMTGPQGKGARAVRDINFALESQLKNAQAYFKDPNYTLEQLASRDKRVANLLNAKEKLEAQLERLEAAETPFNNYLGEDTGAHHIPEGHKKVRDLTYGPDGLKEALVDARIAYEGAKNALAEKSRKLPSKIEEDGRQVQIRYQQTNAMAKSSLTEEQHDALEKAKAKIESAKDNFARGNFRTADKEFAEADKILTKFFGSR